MRYLLQNRIRLLRPDEGFGIFVIQTDIFLNRRDQLRHAMEHAASDAFARDLTEPALDEVQPRRTCRREMQMKTGTLRQPLLHLRMLVSAVVVQDHMDVQLLRRFTVNLPQKLQELLVSVPGG